jgi:hypothetical protein
VIQVPWRSQSIRNVAKFHLWEWLRKQKSFWAVGGFHGINIDVAVCESREGELDLWSCGQKHRSEGLSRFIANHAKTLLMQKFLSRLDAICNFALSDGPFLDHRPTAIEVICPGFALVSEPVVAMTARFVSNSREFDRSCMLWDITATPLIDNRPFKFSIYGTFWPRVWDWEWVARFGPFLYCHLMNCFLCKLEDLSVNGFRIP